MPSTSPTAAGPADRERAALVDAINQVFALFRLNFHNQYLKAYSNLEELNQTKRLWLELLRGVEPQIVLRAAREVVQYQEYLPTFNTFLSHCERLRNGALPDPHSAYLEACRAGSPKSAQRWSHPAVYHAGRAADWYFLRTAPESVAYPVFRQHYEEICRNLQRGASLALPEALPEPPSEPQPPLDREAQAARLQRLRQDLGL